MKSDKFYSSERPTSKLVVSMALGDAVLGTAIKYLVITIVLLLNGYACSKSAESIACPPNTQLDGTGPPWGRWQNCIRPDITVAHGKTYKHGPAVRWFPNGQKRSEQTYIDNALHGQSTTWYVNGNRSKTGRYEKGLKTGIWTEWGVDGTKQATTEYHAGLMHGTRSFFHRNGATKSVHIYITGNLNGPSRSYFQNGQLTEEGQYQDNQKVGTWKRYGPSGQVIAQRQFSVEESSTKKVK